MKKTIFKIQTPPPPKKKKIVISYYGSKRRSTLTTLESHGVNQKQNKKPKGLDLQTSALPLLRFVPITGKNA